MVENRRSDGEKADHRLPCLTGGLKGGYDEQDLNTQAAVLKRLEKMHALFSTLQFCTSTRLIYNSLPPLVKKKTAANENRAPAPLLTNNNVVVVSQ